MNLHGWKRTGQRLKWTSFGMMVRLMLNDSKKISSCYFSNFNNISFNSFVRCCKYPRYSLYDHKELTYNRYRQVSINTVKPSISRKIINEGGSSLEPSEKSSKEMARLTYESASAFIAREYDTLYLRGAVDISYKFTIIRI